MVVESQTTDYNIRIYIGNDLVAAFKISQEEWESGDVSEAINKHIGYAPCDEEEKIIKDAIDDFVDSFSPTGDGLTEETKETGIRPIYRTSNYGAYGVVPVEDIPSSFPKPTKGDDYKTVTDVESQLWPMPAAVATINELESKEGDECLWARPELNAGLSRMQSELLHMSGYSSLAEMAADERVVKAANGEENVGKIAINSAYRRLNTSVDKGQFPDPDGVYDKGDSTGPGHWTGYTVDLGRVRTARRFGFKGSNAHLQDIVKTAANNAGLVDKAWRWGTDEKTGEPVPVGEPHHFRPADEYMLTDWR